MRIAQVAPLTESCPPHTYGGTERLVSVLTEGLVRQGHQVTLFASGDSQTSAILRPACERALRLDPQCRDPLAHHMVMFHQVWRSAEQFEIIHFHTDYFHFPLFAPLANKTLTTLHGRLDLPDLPAVLREFAMMPLVSISHAQRTPVSWANWCGTVFHGLPVECLLPGRGAGGYLAFLGRISPEKGPERAIEIARRAGMPLVIAAKVDKVDREYHRTCIEPLLDDPLIEFVGEVDDREKAALLGDATALLFPIDWPEPFGLVMIEAMAAGTPVVAFRRGSVPEIIEDGVTGFIVESVDDAVAASLAAQKLDRGLIRRRFEARFSAERMTRDYLALYDEVLRHSAGAPKPAAAATAADG